MKKIIKAVVAVLETYFYYESALLFNIIRVFDKIKYKKNEKIRETGRRTRLNRELGC